MISNVLGSPRTTSAGLLAIIVGAAGERIVPAVVEYLGHQPGILWQLLGMAIGLIVPALMVDVKAKLDAAARPQPPAAGGFAPLAVLLVLVALCLAGCSVLSRTTGSTGDLDLGKGVVCSVTLSPVDQAACTKAVSQSCEIPLPQDAAGGCKLDAIVASVPFEPGRGWTCSVTAVAGAKACSKRLVTSCVAPAARGSDGACL